MENELINRSIPCHIESEEAVLSSMFIDEEGLNTGLMGLTATDFYKKNNQIIFEAMNVLNKRGEVVTSATINNYLNNESLLDQIGGIPYLLGIMQASHTSANIKAHIKIVKEKSILREIIRVADETRDMSYSNQEDSSYIIGQAEKKLTDLSNRTSSTDFSKIAEIMPEVLDRMEKASRNDSSITGLETGFRDLNNITAGLQNSSLILIAARPSVGKTAFALNLAQHIALVDKKVTAFFSLEMSKEELVGRVISGVASIDAASAKTGALSDEDWLNIATNIETFEFGELYIDDNASATVGEIKQKCRKLKKDKGLEIVFIDYLQLMNGNSKNENRQQVVSEISRELKLLAMELKIPVVALSQLSRGPEQRSDHRPMLSDLRESGAIEQDADMVIFLYRDELYGRTEDNVGIAEIILSKHRQGSIGTIYATWEGKYTKFSDFDGELPEGYSGSSGE